MKGRLISRKPEEIQSFTDRETMQNVASDQGVYCLSFSPTVLKSTTNSKMDVQNFGQRWKRVFVSQYFKLIRFTGTAMSPKGAKYIRLLCKGDKL